MANFFTMTQQQKSFSFVSPNTVLTRRDHVENPTYKTHTVINLSSPLATDDTT